MMRCLFRILIATFIFATGATLASAQVPVSFYDYVRADLDWYTIETEHFQVHYHSHSAEVIPWTASEVARTAESIYKPITDLYEYEPSGRTSIIIRDFEDYSNGAAYFFDNMIVLWAPALNSPLRGFHKWIQNVVTHEFTHIVQVQKTLKSGRTRPFVYFQALGYEDVRRPDVLYGYPNVIVTYPIPAISNPAWLAEGTAQYQRANFDLDTWDSHRDMLLRTRVLAGRELTLAEMGGFYSHSSLERETVYNQGFAFTLYLANRFGEDVVRKISDELASWKTFNVERAIKAATGIEASIVYQDWIESLTEHYLQVQAQVGDSTDHARITSDGFFNFHPKLSPDGKRIAYLTNSTSSESATHLVVESLGDDEHGNILTSVSVDPGGSAVYRCALGHRLATAVSGSIDWSWDGSSIVFSKRMETAEGYLFADLHVVDIETEDVSRLTTNARAFDPAYSPDDSRIVFVHQSDGTTNLRILDVKTSEVSELTSFSPGTQVYEPSWSSADGGWIFFARADSISSDIYRIRPTGAELQRVVSGPSEDRSPAVSDDGRTVYYASDETGVFNIYSRDLETGRVNRVTNTVGGAFMPDARGSQLVYADYDWDGYDIAMTSAAPIVSENPALHIATPRAMEKTGLGARSGSAESIDITSNDYRPNFTSFSFYPVIRLDQYVTRERSRTVGRVDRRGRLETLARNTKVGLYVNSREILDELSFLGGLLVGPASRPAESFGDYVAPASLLKLERDLFVQFEYRKGIGFKRKRWAPQLSLELFNIRRNVENGLSIEEFSCTACFPPDTSFADISYNLWELNLSARSKLNRYTLAEASYRYSPYRVTTERFFSTEFQQTIPESSSRYFIGKALAFGIRTEVLQRHSDDDVLQSGLKINARYEYEIGSLLDQFDIEDGALVPVYERDKVHRLTLDSFYGQRLPGTPRGATHGIGIRARLSSVIGPTVDSFYNDYVGGLVGARGYPFYALGGNETAWGQISYTFPLLPDVARQLGFLYIDKLFLKAYADAALAWSGKIPALNTVRKDVGAELRIVTGSFYLLPSAIFVSGTYGIDEFEFEIDDTFVTPGGDETVTYGGSFQVHAGLLFSFDL
ncbi:MAG: hypothetical protein HKN43_09060 [Rhodothermales bacterium]|nr:hypothetical protein [Rhodothermales bacterium]